MSRIQGEVIAYVGNLGLPAGWVPCDGVEYGGVVTPDLRGRIIIGSGGDFELMQSYGSTDNFSHTISTDNHVLTIDQMPSHNHRYECRNIYDNDTHNGASGGRSANDSNAHYSTQSTGGSHAHNHGSKTIDTTPPMLSLRYICYIGENYRYAAY